MQHLKKSKVRFSLYFTLFYLFFSFLFFLYFCFFFIQTCATTHIYLCIHIRRICGRRMAETWEKYEVTRRIYVYKLAVNIIHLLWCFVDNSTNVHVCSTSQMSFKIFSMIYFYHLYLYSFVYQYILFYFLDYKWFIITLFAARRNKYKFKVLNNPTINLTNPKC